MVTFYETTKLLMLNVNKSIILFQIMTLSKIMDFKSYLYKINVLGVLKVGCLYF